MKTKKGYVADVHFSDPRKNKMFTPLQHAITQFLTYTRPVKCAFCGRKSKHMWTQCMFFRVYELSSFSLNPSTEEYPPLTPVCRKHILQPNMK